MPDAEAKFVVDDSKAVAPDQQVGIADFAIPVFDKRIEGEHGKRDRSAFAEQFVIASPATPTVPGGHGAKGNGRTLREDLSQSRIADGADPFGRHSHRDWLAGRQAEVTSNASGKQLVGHTLNADFGASRWLEEDFKFFAAIYLDGNAQGLVTTLFGKPIKTYGVGISNHLLQDPKQPA